MSATKMSTWPSRSTSEKSTAMEELLAVRSVAAPPAPALIVGDVEVEVPVPGHVGQGHRHAARVGGEPRLGRALGEHAVPVVEKERHALAEGADEQVEVAVAVHIGEHGSRRVPPRQGNAGPGRDILEAP